MNSDGIIMGYVRSLEPAERERTSVWLAGDPPIVEWFSNTVEPKRTRKPSLKTILQEAKAVGASAVEIDGAKVSLAEAAPPEPDALDQWLEGRKRDAH